MITVEERNACERETLPPEPANGLGFGVGKIVLVDGKGISYFVAYETAPRDFRFAERGIVLFQQFFERGDG